jgi:O-Antigen ligase
MTPERKLAANEIYALAFGLFLGLAILKFGDPVILDRVISPPNSFSEFWNDSWPTYWANWIFFPLAGIGAAIAFAKKSRRPSAKWPWLLPLLWFGWQIFSATQTVDPNLTTATLWQFAGCVASYFLGFFLLGSRRALNFLLIGILAAFAFCLVRAVNQRLVEFPQSYKVLVEGQRAGWTNIPPKMILEMKHDQTIITTNGVDVVNPAILAKFAKNRVMGTMIYPNALAGIILLLFPVAIEFAFNSTKKLRPIVRAAAIALTLFLGGAAFFWTGSKLGWLIAMAIGGFCLFRLRWLMKLKILSLVLIAVFGLSIFAIRFHHYFAKGATSVVARFDYWHAAVQTTVAHPLLGTGPGTFQRPYAKLKSPEAEMARLAHNDYLEQFSDSGIPGGIFYLGWIATAMIFVGRKFWKSENQITFALFLGLLGWFVQGLGEFGLFIPASAWIAFTFLGCALALAANPFDKNPATAKIPAK